MRGQRERSGSLFSYVSIEERIPTERDQRSGGKTCLIRQFFRKLLTGLPFLGGTSYCWALRCLCSISTSLSSGQVGFSVAQRRQSN
jgi:hypothetical protein